MAIVGEYNYSTIGRRSHFQTEIRIVSRISRVLIIIIILDHASSPIAIDALLKSTILKAPPINGIVLMRIYGGMLDIMNSTLEAHMAGSINRTYPNRTHRNFTVWNNRTSLTARPPLGMADEVARALSFQPPFPFARLHPLTPAKLAAAGFYHFPAHAIPDRAVCFSCGLALHSWCTSFSAHAQFPVLSEGRVRECIPSLSISFSR